MDKVSIVIELDEKGVVNVTAPMGNKILCFGMLEMARQIIHDEVMKPKSNIIQPEFKMNGRGN